MLELGQGIKHTLEMFPKLSAGTTKLIGMLPT